MPFSPAEQAVVVHKYLIEFGKEARKPVDLSNGPNKRFLGDVRLKIRKDGTLCSHLAREEYNSDLGARSLISAVDEIKDKVVQSYLEIDEEVKEGGAILEFVVDINGSEIEIRMIPPAPKMEV